MGICTTPAVIFDAPNWKHQPDHMKMSLLQYIIIAGVLRMDELKRGEHIDVAFHRAAVEQYIDMEFNTTPEEQGKTRFATAFEWLEGIATVYAVVGNLTYTQKKKVSEWAEKNYDAIEQDFDRRKKLDEAKKVGEWIA